MEIDKLKRTIDVQNRGAMSDFLNEINSLHRDIQELRHNNNDVQVAMQDVLNEN